MPCHKPPPTLRTLASLLGLALASFLFAPELRAQSPPPTDKTTKVESVWQLQEFMVPMRDGVHLQTVVITRKDQTNPLPILLRRTPYGVPAQDEFDKSAAKNGADWMPANWKDLAAAGYIFVVQNLRGRFKSEGVFLMTQRYDANDPMYFSRGTGSWCRCSRHGSR
jgi:uncharacterized protein